MSTRYNKKQSEKEFILKHTRSIVVTIGVLILLIGTAYASGLLDSPKEKLNRMIQQQDELRDKEVQDTDNIISRNQVTIDNLSRINTLSKECIVLNRSNQGKANLVIGCQAYINKMLIGIKNIKEEILNNSNTILLKPNELFYTIKVKDKPYVSQTEQNHYKKENGGMLATDVAAGFKTELFAPDYLSNVIEYTVEYISKDKLLGNNITLRFNYKDGEYRFVLGHIKTRLSPGDHVVTGQRIGEMDMSGATTGYHSHVELWSRVGTEWKNVTLTTRTRVLLNKRAGKFDTPKGNTIYLTSYDLGDINQNDASPCIGASGKDLCKIATTSIQTIALTSDMRKKLGIKFGDNIQLKSKATGRLYDVQVHDEMNQRFRYGCIKKLGYCIKGDIARYKGKSNLLSGVYTIIK